MENLRRIVAEHPFCKDLESYYVDLLAGCASNVRFDADQYVFREGGNADQFYLIRKGRVALEMLAPTRKLIIVETVGDGDALGWSWLIPPYRWHFDARAVQPVRALVLDGKCLRGKCEKNHDLGYELVKRVLYVAGQRLEAKSLQVMDMYSTDAPAGPKAERTRK
jgi:CRP-like cAMP-binding protein